MKKVCRVFMPVVLCLFSILFCPRFGAAWWIQIQIGTQTDGTRGVAIQIGDESGQKWAAQLLCESCHSSSPESKAALAKPYDAQSQMNHEQKYFRENNLQIAGLTKYVLDKDIYLATEKGRLVLVNGREQYKLLFGDDVVVLLGGNGRPAFIHGIKSYTKTRIGPLPAPVKR